MESKSKPIRKRQSQKAEVKVDAFLLIQDFPLALSALSRQAHNGAHVFYKPHAWKDMPNGYQVYSSAMMRHIFSEQTEPVDPETGEIAEVATAWNALARLELALQGKKND